MKYFFDRYLLIDPTVEGQEGTFIELCSAVEYVLEKKIVFPGRITRYAPDLFDIDERTKVLFITGDASGIALPFTDLILNRKHLRDGFITGVISKGQMGRSRPLEGLKEIVTERKTFLLRAFAVSSVPFWDESGDQGDLKAIEAGLVKPDPKSRSKLRHSPGARFKKGNSRTDVNSPDTSTSEVLSSTKTTEQDKKGEKKKKAKKNKNSKKKGESSSMDSNSFEKLAIEGEVSEELKSAPSDDVVESKLEKGKMEFQSPLDPIKTRDFFKHEAILKDEDIGGVITRENSVRIYELQDIVSISVESDMKVIVAVAFGFVYLADSKAIQILKYKYTAEKDAGDCLLKITTSDLRETVGVCLGVSTG
jgi:hypothetical protein